MWNEPQYFGLYADHVQQVVQDERNRLGLPCLMPSSILGKAALDVLSDPNVDESFEGANKAFSEHIQRAGYLTMGGILAAVVGWHPHFLPGHTNPNVAAQSIGDAIIGEVKGERSSLTINALGSWVASLGMALHPAAHDIGIAMAPASSQPGVVMMIAIGAADFSSSVLTGINRARMSSNIAPLALNYSLRGAARKFLAMPHSPSFEEFMRVSGEFDYGDPEEERIRTGYNGVNVILTTPINAVKHEELIESVVQTILDERGEQLLRRDWQDIGLAMHLKRAAGVGHFVAAEYVLGWKLPMGVARPSYFPPPLDEYGNPITHSSETKPLVEAEFDMGPSFKRLDATPQGRRGWWPFRRRR